MRHELAAVVRVEDARPGADRRPTRVGGEVMARTWTPDEVVVLPSGARRTTIHTKRACNGCGRLIGDVLDAEIDAVMDGLPLPDVREECPTCGHKEIVGPVPTVRFRGGPWRGWDVDYPKVAYQPPKNTLDPLYAACSEHRVACDCREAEFAEDRQEFNAWRRETEEAFAEILAGHATWAWAADGNTFTGCMCTGCQIARAAHIHAEYLR